MTTEMRPNAQANRGDADRRHAGNEPVRDRCLGGIRPAHRWPAARFRPGFILELRPRTGNPTGPAGQLDFWNYDPATGVKIAITHLESRPEDLATSGAQEGERRRLYPGPCPAAGSAKRSEVG